MTHISQDLLNSKTISLWLITIAILAFASGYCLGNVHGGGSAQAINNGGQSSYTDLAMGKYGHLFERP